jgi:hypothetical protein
MADHDAEIRDRLNKLFNIINQDNDASLNFSEFKDLFTGEGQEISDNKAIMTAKRMLAQADTDNSRSATLDEWCGMFSKLQVRGSNT